jgi:phosphonate ABC transporter permease subunit PhnE
MSPETRDRSAEGQPKGSVPAVAQELIEQSRRQHAERVAAAHRRGLIQAGLINALLCWYGLGGGLLAGRWLWQGWVLGEPFFQRPTSFGLGVHALVLALSVLLGLWWTRSALSPGRMATEHTTPLLVPTAARVEGGWWRSLHGLSLLALLGLTFTLGVLVVEVSPRALLETRSLEAAGRLFRDLFTPETRILPIVLEKMVETVFIALVATAVAVPIAFLLAFFAARNLVGTRPLGLTIYAAVRFIANLSRSIEPVLWAIVFSVWVGFGPFAGMLALLVHSVASLIKLYSEQIESISTGPIEAIEATGANRVQVVWYAVVPQVVLPYLSYTIYRWDINVRMATIIGLVGGGGVGELLMQYLGLARYSEVGMIVIVITAVVWSMDWLSSKVRG